MPILPLMDRTSLEQVLLSRLSRSEVQQWVQKYSQPYRELMSYYRCASPPRASWKSSAAAVIP